MRWLPLAVVAAAALGSPVGAQPPRFTVGAGGGVLRMQSTSASLTDELRGLVMGGRGSLAVRGLDLELAYYEGTLTPDAGAAIERDIADGHAMLGGRPKPWLLVQGGLHARGYVQAGIAERWLVWEGRGRADLPLIPPSVRAHSEIRQGLKGTVTNAAGPFRASRAGEGGIAVRVPRTPFWLGVAYAIERDQVKVGAPTLDAVETIRITLGSAPDR